MARYSAHSLEPNKQIASNQHSGLTAQLAEAQARHRAGDWAEAEKHYAKVLRADKTNPQAMTLLGTLHAQQGNFAGAIKLLIRSLKIDARQPFALNSLGNALNSLRRYDKALAAFERALALKTDHAAVYNNRGSALRGLGRLEEALASIDKAISLSPEYPEAINNRGLVLHDLRRPEDALKSYERAIALKANFAEAHRNIADQLLELKRIDAALTSYDRALLLEPDNAEFYSSRGNALRQLKRYDEAIDSCEQAIARCPDSVQAHFIKGLALQESERNEEALASYDRAISLRPAFAAGYNNRGNVLVKLHRHKEALKSFETSIRLDPDAAEVHANRGAVLRTLRRPVDALKSYERAVAISPDCADYHFRRGLVLQDIRRAADAVQAYDMTLALNPDYANAYHRRAIALKELERFDEALASIEKAIELDPDIAYVLGERLVIKTQSCDWGRLEEATNAVIEAVGRGARASTPFALLAMHCAQDVRRKCAEIFMRDQHPPRSEHVGPIRRSESGSGDRIRVAYVSGDFRAHAVGSLIVGVLEQHDRARFDVHAISFGRDDRSAARARLAKAAEHFIDVRETADTEVASLLRAMNIDIAVDLMGFTGSCRTGILAHRPAPIQINYLGYPGTMGADYIDYLIADRVVIPDKEQCFYAENIVYLPDTYQGNDSKRRIGKSTLTRATAGLPLDDFVFCSFNNNYKIRPEMFDVWMSILQQTEGSVLWLLRSNPHVERNLRHEAERRGVSGERLVFAPRLAASDHLARHHLADLFLDTQPYGAHTTASDALWAGLPVLTCQGESFAGRVAASLLKAIGLPEMVTYSLEEYEARALTLAHDRSALAEVKARLAHNRETLPLFDTVRFTRHLEAAFTRMWQRHQDGDPPAPFAVEPDAG